MKKLSIAIDMGAKNNGVFMVKTDGDKIIDKKASCIVIDGNKINFSKKSRRKNRHKDRNYKRRKLAKRLLDELVDMSQYDQKQAEFIFGTLNNRGYTLLSSENEFEELSDETMKFNKLYLEAISGQATKEKFELYFTDEFDDDKALLNFLDTNIKNIKKTISNLINFSKKDKILDDLVSLKTNSIKKFNAFSHVKILLSKYGYRDLGKNEKDITEKLKNNNIYLSKFDFDKEKQDIESLNFDKESVKDKSIITKDLKLLKEFLSGIQKEIATGAKPRKQYLKEIKEEIEKQFDFIQNFTKDEFFNIVGNISNLQLRILRKFFNKNSTKNSQLQVLKRYFVAFHYKDEAKSRRKKLFVELNKHNDILSFFKTCDPELTSPPYEDMNNRDTYKCNSMLIKPELITDDIKKAIDILLSKDEFATITQEIDKSTGEFKHIGIRDKRVSKHQKLSQKELSKYNNTDNHAPIIYQSTDWTYSKYLQRIFDMKLFDKITKYKNADKIYEENFNSFYHPRNVFKHTKKFEKGKIDSIELFKKLFGKDTYDSLKPIAEIYYKEEQKIKNGIYSHDTSVFVKCGTNTPYKNNAKHMLLKPLYSYSFTTDESDKYLEAIKKTRGLQTQLELISNEAKKHQNGFYNIVKACFDDDKCVADKEIKKIITNLNPNLEAIQTIFKDLNIEAKYFNSIEKVDENNLTTIINILKQTFEILFKELSGFNKTCKTCTKENADRSDQTFPIAQRLLSDVAKPIDGMLDMMIDRLAHEITANIDKSDIEDIVQLDILLEQNRFEFEENLNVIKRASNKDIKKLKREYKDRLNIDICPYSGKQFDKGDYDHILPQSKGVYNSKANMIYVSSDGNQNIKGATTWTLDMLKKPHLNTMFHTDNIKEIKEFIKTNIARIDQTNFTNFDNLKLNEQIAFRYALFMEHTSSEFKTAFDLLKKDKLKTITNGTQKRLARLVYEKLVQKFPYEFNAKNKNKTLKIDINSNTIDHKLVSTTRRYLAVDQTTGEINHLFKEDIQDSHSHCIDAMVVFYLANSDAQKIKRSDNLSDKISKRVFNFDFKDIYVEESSINNIAKNKTFINSPKKELGSYKLFDDTIYSENYKHITKENTTKKELEILVKYLLLFVYEKGKKIVIDNIEKVKEKTIYKIDIQKVSNTIYKLFNNKDKPGLVSLKFLDKYQYFTSRKEIQNIFFDDKKTKLLEYEKIKNIPYFSNKLYKAVYKKLLEEKKLFDISDDKKTILNSKILEELLQDMFDSKQKAENKKQRKRGKKRHKYSLPILGSPKFRIKRGKTWQVLGNKDIATKNYIIDGDIKPVPYFSKNTIPLKIKDLIDCLLVNKDDKNIYSVTIDTTKICDYVSNLTYLITEAKRCTVISTFVKASFVDVDISSVGVFDGAKDKVFESFIANYIDNKDLELSKYIGSIRDGINAKATIVDNNNQTITLKYKASINKDKKQIILDNLKDK